MKPTWNNSANKFFDALAAGKPIAINYGGWQADLLQHIGAGIVLPPEDIEQAARLLADFVQDTDRLHKASTVARDLAHTRFSRDRLAAQLETVLRSTAAQKQSITPNFAGDKMIHLIDSRATSTQMQEMLETYPLLIKIVVDIRRHILAGGGEMHADCAAVLLEHGSTQDDLWGANWYPEEQHLEFESLINIRPRLGNRSIIIQSEELRQKVADVTLELLGGVQ